MMLHNEARQLLVEGFKRTHNAKSIAEAFGVSIYTVYHLVEKHRATGSVKLKTYLRGRKQLISDDEKQQIKKSISEKPDITIKELIDNLRLHASYSTVARIVHRMGYTRKKKSLHASEQERPRCAAKTN